ncbi:MAG: hypothetical protein HY236_05675 [Acidobacteria bacterium]|nr:hypothetical protein [Acidobacteriota bacterium]
MKSTLSLCFLLLLLFSVAAGAPDTLASRIAHTDPSRFAKAPGAHGGAGELDYTGLFAARTPETNLLFLAIRTAYTITPTSPRSG